MASPSRSEASAPATPEALRQRLRAAIDAHQAGHLETAIAGYETVLAAVPDSPAARYNLGDIRLRRGEAEAARTHLERAAALTPGQAQIWARLAQARQRTGDAAGAFAAAETGLDRDPDCHNARFALALAARDRGDWATAEAALAELLDAGVAEASVRLELGRVALARDDSETACRQLAQAHALRPGHLDTAINRATAQYRAGDGDGALASLAAVASDGAAVAAWHGQRGLALYALGRKDEAEDALRQAVALGSANPRIYQTLATCCFARNALGDAAAQVSAGLALLGDSAADAPARARLLNELATIYRNQGRLAAAREALETACQAAPELSLPHSNYLMLLHYLPEESAPSIYRAHLAWQARHAAELEAAATPPAPGPAAKAPLVVGILGRKFRYGPPLALYLPAFEHLDPAAVRLIVYDLGSSADARHQRLRRAASAWRDVQGWADADVTAQIRADGVDILINKMGHAEGNMGICAMKPAPVQVQWGGFNSSALAGMDWFLGDPVATPEGCEGYFTERLYRLPQDYVVFDPPTDLAGPVAPLPARESGRVTFGCFNHPAKINESVAALWARVLAAVPGSRLFLKGPAFDDADATAHLKAVLARGGVEPQRVHLAGWSPAPDLLAAYGHVDIALDPWPYSGGLTTLEALWMGVPTVTLPGPTFVGRHAAAHMSHSGLGDWVAADGADYVAKAAAWAHDLDALARLRAGLRDRVAAAPVCDGPRFARNLAAALQAMQAEASSERG